MPAKRQLVDSDLSDDDVPPPKRQTTASRAPTKSAPSGRGQPKKSYIEPSDSEAEEEVEVKPKRGAPAASKPKASNGKTKAKQDDYDVRYL
jgi:hypothetical protein